MHATVELSLRIRDVALPLGETGLADDDSSDDSRESLLLLLRWDAPQAGTTSASRVVEEGKGNRKGGLRVCTGSMTKF